MHPDITLYDPYIWWKQKKLDLLFDFSHFDVVAIVLYGALQRFDYALFYPFTLRFDADGTFQVARFQDILYKVIIVSDNINILIK